MSIQEQMASVAPVITYTSTASALTIWGAHASDVAVIFSAGAALCGAIIQVLGYIDRHKWYGHHNDDDDDHDGPRSQWPGDNK